jgi:6-methylpretetramide 4-monooxygenase
LSAVAWLDATVYDAAYNVDTNVETNHLIVGGGIGGLVLAELLGRSGAKVVVLERSTGPPPWNRPEILWPATFELLCAIIPKAQLEQEGVLPLAGMELFDGQKFQWVISPEILAQSRVQPWSTNPNQTRELLMRQTSFELHRGVEVKQVLKEQAKIVGVRAREILTGREQDWLARQTVGDDGVHSLVREACGIELKTRLFPLDLLCFQADWPAEFRPDAGRLWPNRKSPTSGILAAGVIPVPSRKGVGVIPVQARIFDDPPRAQAAWRDFLESAPSLAALVGSRRFPDDFQRVRRPWGHAPRYGAAGAFLMGDAAHPVSPAGGQGANMSIADARVLAQLILNGRSDVLTTYERRRRPANGRSMRFTRLAALAFGLPEGMLFSSPLYWLGRFVGNRPSLIAYVIRLASTAFLER